MPSPPPRAAERDPLLTVKEVAKRLTVSERSVRRWIADGDLEVIRLGRCVRIASAAVDRLVRRP